MSEKIFTVAILGCGGRGGEAYGRLFAKMPEKFRIVSICDYNPEKLKKYGRIYGVPEEMLFSDEKEFFAARRADVLTVTTMDADHVRQAEEGLRLGYDLLLEKPISDSREECLRLLGAQKKYGGKVLVCHVLRYAPAFRKVFDLIREGTIGRLVAVQAVEQVAYWHQAHSYVRGNWRRTEDTTPMILAKCCHDLDLLQWYAGARCESVSSVGDLTFFNEKNAPENTAARCMECRLRDSCPYSAKVLYVDRWKKAGSPENEWPYNVLTTALPLTEEAIRGAIEKGPYGRCVFRCDNDAVDHQLTQMTFANGVKATLTMTAFTAEGGRIMKFCGTLGEIVLNETEDKIDVKPFGKAPECLRIGVLEESGYAHGGGDYGLISELYEVLSGRAKPETSLEASVESHLMGIAAEESRLQGGALIRVHA